MMPDRHGNNRADSLRNIVRDPQRRAAVPGAGLRHDAARQRPRAMLSVDDAAARLLRRRRQDAALGHRRRRRDRLLPVRTRHPSLRAVEPGPACRSEVAADAGRDPRRPSAPTGSAARPTTANGRSGRRRRCGERAGVAQAIRSTSATLPHMIADEVALGGRRSGHRLFDQRHVHFQRVHQQRFARARQEQPQHALVLVVVVAPHQRRAFRAAATAW